MSEIKEKPFEDYTEEDVREMFLVMFFWVAENRPEWLEEAINRRKRQLGRK